MSGRERNTGVWGSRGVRAAVAAAAMLFSAASAPGAWAGTMSLVADSTALGGGQNSPYRTQVNGLSGNGQYLTGVLYDGNPTDANIWSPDAARWDVGGGASTTLKPLRPQTTVSNRGSWGAYVANDGVVVGRGTWPSDQLYMSYVWPADSASGGGAYTALGLTPNVQAKGDTGADLRGLSADGRTAVMYYDYNSPVVTRLPAGITTWSYLDRALWQNTNLSQVQAETRAVSADGTRLGGWADNNGVRVATLWTDEGAGGYTVQRLGTGAGKVVWLSSDGNRALVLGAGGSSTYSLWTSDGGLTPMPGLDALGSVSDIESGIGVALWNDPSIKLKGVLDGLDDGTAFVGRRWVVDHYEGFYWDPVRGLRTIDKLLQDEGIAGLGEGWLYTDVIGISDDGLTLAGNAVDANGVVSGWVMQRDSVSPGDPVPEPATLVLLGTGLVGLAAAGRRARRA